MDLDEALRAAQSGTDILRARKNLLYTFGATRLPYVCLSDDEDGHVHVREGEVAAERPRITLPGPEAPRFEGFSGGGDEEGGDGGDMLVVLLARQIAIPAANYVNDARPARREAGTLEQAAARALERLDNANDIRTGVLTAPDRFWNLGVLLYVGSQVARSAPANVAEHLERFGPGQRP